MIDPPARCLHHPPCHRLCDEECGTLIEIGDGIVVLFGHLEERRRPIGAGVVHQDVERRLRIDRRAHRVQVGHIQYQGLGAASFINDLR